MAETEKNLTKIPLSFVAANGVKALSNRPNQETMFGGKGGMSPEQLKAVFDRLAEELVDRVNSIIEIITSKNNGDTVSVESLGSSSETMSLNEFVRSIKSGELFNYILLQSDESITGKKVSLSSEIAARLVVIQTLAERLDTLQKETAEATESANTKMAQISAALSGVDTTLFQEIDELRRRIQAGEQEGGAQGGAAVSSSEVTIADSRDAVVVNGEIRLPAKGLEYELNEDGLSYKVVGLGTCTDINVVVPRKYNGLPITAVGDNAFESAQIDSVHLWETVTRIGGEAFFDCSALRFVYVYSETPIPIQNRAIPYTVKGVFVPLHIVESCKVNPYWRDYTDKVVAIETPESINTTIVNVYKALSANDENLGQLIQNLSASDTALQQCIENLANVDAYLSSQITELQGYSQGLDYVVVQVNGVLGFGVAGPGTCTDTDIVIPPTYNGFPVLKIADMAFMTLAGRHIVVPEGIKEIGAQAFFVPSAKVTFLSKTPPKFDFNVFFNFAGSPDNVFVSHASVDAYKSALRNYANVNITPIETLETLRADINELISRMDSIDLSSSELVAEIDTLIGEGV